MINKKAKIFYREKMRLLSCIGRIISVLLILSVIVSLVPVSAVDYNTIYIRNTDDLIDLAKKCMLDTYSFGKTVILQNDINVSTTEFTCIQTFNGTFDGNGHTIINFNIFSNGSNVGFFRYLKENAVVKNLSVKGTVNPGGSNAYVGGICGSNEGRIINCTFSGMVNASSYVGGICGQNLSTGTVSGCSSDGIVYGHHYVGGICGQNFGTVSSSKNGSNVNTTAEKVKFDIEKIDFEHLISTQNTIDITDIGGICGFSAGIVQSCENIGIVGYEHVGYNIGGICGRQSGYVNMCKNSAKIYGRKDVGGICGQMEPYTSLKYSESTIDQLNAELDELKKITDSILDNADINKDAVSSQLNNLKAKTDNAIDAVKDVSDKTGDFLNNNIDNINDASARLTGVIDGVSEQLDKFDEINEDLDSFIDAYADIADKIRDATDVDTDKLKNSLDDISDGIDEIRKAMDSLSKSLGYLKKVLYDVEDISDAANEVSDSIEELKKSVSNLKEAVTNFRTAAEDVLKAVINKDEDLQKYFTAQKEALDKIISSLSKIEENLKNTKESFSSLKDSVLNLNVNSLIKAVTLMADFSSYMSVSMREIESAVDKLAEVTDQIDFDAIKELPDDIRAANEYIKSASEKAGDVIGKVGDILDEYSKTPVITIEKISDEYKSSVDTLKDRMTDINNCFDSVNTTLTRIADTAVDDMRRLSDQMFKVFDTMADLIDSAFEDDLDIEDKITDISDEDTAYQTTGKVSDCSNTGEVSGDVNVGGISGSMAIEYDFDPEDDIHKTGKRSVNFLFQTRAIIRNCRNNAGITGKKNYVGGICGNVSLGCIINCAALGKIKSTSGDYVGGICGINSSTVKNSNAKCTVAGDDYVGGISGSAAHLYDCRAVVRIEESDEYTGAIAGEKTGECLRNVFVSDTLGGIDSISYIGIAEPVSVEQISNGGVNSDVFKRYQAEFIIDGKSVKTIEFSYGESLDESDFPEIPAKEGNYAVWDAETFENLTYDLKTEAEYHPYILAIDSELKRDNGLAAVVCEGMFKNETELKAESIKQNKRPSSTPANTVECINLKVSDMTSVSKVHYLPSEEDISLMVYDGNEFKRVNYEQDGKYLVFDSSGSDITFIAVRKAKWLTYVIIAVSAAAVIFVMTAIFIGIRRRKKKFKA